MSGGQSNPNDQKLGKGLYLSEGAWDTFHDVSAKADVQNEKAYNRQPSFGDVNKDGFLDIAAGTNHLRIECLRSLTITTDKNGVPLNPPVTLLMAGSGELTGSPRRAVVFVRNDGNSTWTVTYPGSVTSGTASTRMIFDHVDRALPTPVHYVFCAFGGKVNTLVRGGYNATTGLIDCDADTPELTANERMLSAGDCNAVLYACVGSDGNPTNNIGGVFWREDGTNAQWHFVYEWSAVTKKNPDICGFTAVPHPKGFGYDVALVTLKSFGKVFCIEPIGGKLKTGSSAPARRRGGGIEDRFKQYDKNGDGKLIPSEFPMSSFQRVDKNNDGVLTLDEVRAFYGGGRRRQANQEK